MRGITKILAVIDSRKEEQLALARAAQFSRISGATLHILSPNPNATIESMNRLEALAAPLVKEGLDIHLHETWHDHLTDTIIHIRQIERCHLIIKDARPLKAMKNTFKTPNDWSLLRRSRVPVLLVKTDKPWDHAPILAAINADPDDYHHTAMNTAILDYASELAFAYASEVHLATAYPTTNLAARNYQDNITDEQAYRQHCIEYIHRYNLDEKHVFVEPGPTETMITKIIKDSDARLLVLGTHARTGLGAFAIGNTAEQLISQIDTDILVLQPRHHMMPLERELDN
ncbi:hypothetical protein ACH42_15250 [Endozoicomonas sp. (ex Bugula neritina AB1)]|nr:hypothetical protein ACH42_15250 [Endozoicomonas sp. (ex Bugula neritina AB1)]